MDFIMDNYLWIGIVGVVLLMALIGFLAEKTNFITNSNIQPKKEKKSKRGKKGNDESVVSEMSFTPESTEEIIESPSIMIDEQPENFDVLPVEMLEVALSDNTEPNIEAAPIDNSTWNIEEQGLTTDETPMTITESGEDLTVPLSDENVTIDNGEPKKEDVPVTTVEEEDIWEF